MSELNMFSINIKKNWIKTSNVNNRSELVLLAKLAEQTDRYDDMALAMKRVAEKWGALSDEERNMLSVAYKNVIGSRRAAWQVISSVERKSEGTRTVNYANEYRMKIAKELQEICQDVLKLLKDHILKNNTQPENIVFFLKMEGDYNRYLAEISNGDIKNNAIQKAMESYQKATTVSDRVFDTIHPIRLGLALNHSVFYYEIMFEPEKACDLARVAFDNAILKIDNLQEDTYKDSTLIMQLLRDNISLWTIESDNEPEEESDDI